MSKEQQSHSVDKVAVMRARVKVEGGDSPLGPVTNCCTTAVDDGYGSTNDEDISHSIGHFADDAVGDGNAWSKQQTIATWQEEMALNIALDCK